MKTLNESKKYAIKLIEFDNYHISKMAINAQVLANFVIELEQQSIFIQFTFLESLWTKETIYKFYIRPLI